MRRGIPERRSRTAGWARLAGGLALPVLALSVAGARIGIITPVALQPVIVAGFVLGFVALGLALYSLADIWVSGAEGAGLAIAGIVYASPVLVMLGLIAAAAIVYPRVTDVTTDLGDPPRFFAPGAVHLSPDSVDGEVQRAAYPKIVPHHYPLSLGDVYIAVREVFEDRGWSVTRDVHPPFMPTAPAAPASTPVVAEDGEIISALALKSEMTQSRSGMATEKPGVGNADEGDGIGGSLVGVPAGIPPDRAFIEASASTLIFGFLDDVVVRLQAMPDGGTKVDMRSASRSGEHDLGQNARRIRRFFAALDARLQPDPDRATR